MKIYYSGAEIPGWRRLMVANGVRYAAFSYMGLRRRTKFIRPWLIREKVTEPLTLLLDSGAHTVNGRPDLYPAADVLMERYEQFVAANIEDVEAALEFDVLALGLDVRKAHRDRMREIAPGKFIPVWHAVDTIPELHRLAETFPTIALADFEKDLANVSRHLHQLAHDGSSFVGLAMLKPERIRALPLSAVTGTAWLSPTQHGETVIYTGGELHRFHAKNKESTRARYRTQIEAFGIDAAKVADGDGTELLSLSLRSWEAFVHALAAKHPATPSQRNGDPAVHEAVSEATETRHEPGRRKLMPGIEFYAKGAGTETDGEPRAKLLKIVDSGMLACDTCYIKDNCPEHKPGAECAYELPIELGAPGQLRALVTAVITVQAKRVFFARMAEEREGGFPNPVVSSELDRFIRLVSAEHRLDQSEFTLHMKATTGGAGQPTLTGGIISQVFGRDPVEQRAIEPVQADPTVSAILDAEFVEEP